MLRTSETENEIVLGNKQLAGIFLVVAILLGVAFTGGYMVGKGGVPKKATVESSEVAPAIGDTASSGAGKPAAGSGGQTHLVGADDGLASTASEAPDRPALGARRAKEAGAEMAEMRPVATAHTPDVPERGTAAGYAPRPGTRYLQVTAVGRDEAEAVADVLHKKGFRAHAVPKPGSAKLYRVIVGPVRDSGDLSSTRDALRKVGFREVIVQNY